MRERKGGDGGVGVGLRQEGKGGLGQELRLLKPVSRVQITYLLAAVLCLCHW